MFVFLFCTQIAVADVYESAIELYVSFNPSPAASGAGGGGFSYNTTKFSVTADKYASIKSSGSSHASTSFASTKAVVTKQCIEERLVSKSETAVNCSSQQQEVHLFSVLNFIFSFEFNLLVIYYFFLTQEVRIRFADSKSRKGLSFLLLWFTFTC